MPTKKSPRHFGLPHDKWRPAQYDAFSQSEKAFNITDYVFIEAPVGIGKSGVATALGNIYPTTVVVQNLGLLKQYESYGFKIIMGRNEYKCVLPSKIKQWKNKYNKTPTAADCHMHKMHLCPMSAYCPYLKARTEALSAHKMACTYKYSALSENVINRGGLLVFDEAHNCIEEFLSVAQFELTSEEAKEYDFDPFPLKNYGEEKGGVLTEDDKDIVIDWLLSSLSKVAVVNIFDEMTERGSKQKKIFQSITNALSVVKYNKRVFYKCSDQKNKFKPWYKNKYSYYIMSIKSLNPSNMFRKIISNKDKVLFMSATLIPKVIANSLYLSKYRAFSYPHPIPVEKRQVWDLGVPKMTYSNLKKDNSLYKFQADKISSFIKTLRPDWRIVVLTSSNKKINLLKGFLRQEFRGRIMDLNGSLQERIDTFKNNKIPGKIIVDTIQGWGTGVDLDWDTARCVVVAGVPFSNPSDPFEKARMEERSGREYAFARAYNTVMQATGRVTRGEKLNNGEYLKNIGVLADGSATSFLARRYYSQWFKDAIKEYNNE